MLDMIIIPSQWGWSLLTAEEGTFEERLVASADDPEQLVKMARTKFGGAVTVYAPIQTNDPFGTEMRLAEVGRCSHQTGYGLPWMEYCGVPLPCPEHPEG